MVQYVGCYMDANLRGESMTRKSLKKINAKLQFLYRQKGSLNKKSGRLF